MTDYTTAQLATILSALAGKECKPATKAAAMRALRRHTEEIGRTLEDVLAFAPGLIDGRLDLTTWREQLAGTAQPDMKGEAREPAEAAGSAPVPADLPLRPGTKQALIAGMLARDQGATRDELIAATGWLPHTTRAALTGLRRKGFALDKSSREDSKTAYRIELPDKPAAHDTVPGGAA